MSRNHVIVRNTAFLAAGQVFTMAFSLVSDVLVPRSIGPAAFGAIAVAGAINAMVGAVLGFAMGKLLIRDTARYPERAAEYVGAALATRLVLVIPYVLTVACVVFINGFHGGYKPEVRLIIAIVTATNLVLFLVGPINAGLLALERMQYTSLADVVSNALSSLTVVVLVSLSIVSAPAVAAIGLGTALIVGRLQYGWLRRAIPVRVNFDWKLMRYLFVGSIPFAITFLFLQFYTAIDSVMLSYFTTTVEVGWYSVASRLYTTLMFLPTIVSTALFPQLSYNFQHNLPEMRHQVSRSFTLLMSLSLPISGGIVLVGPSLVALVYTSAYAPAESLVIVLGIALVPTYLNILINQVLITTDRQVVWTRVMAVMCVVNPAINLVTIRLFEHAYGNGAMGAALALLATEGMMGVIALRLLPPGILGRASLAPVLRSALATAIMVGGVWYVRNVFVVVPVALGVVIYAGAALALRVFSQDDLELIGGFLARILNRLGLRSLVRTREEVSAGNARVTLRQLIAADLRAWKAHEQLYESALEQSTMRLTFWDVLRLLWCYPGTRATLTYRLSAAASRRHIPLVPGMLARRNVWRYGLDIAPTVPIGAGLCIAHPFNMVIRAQVIGRNCHLSGSSTLDMRERGRFPTVGDDVVIAVGARILGGVHIGDRAQIEANTVVLRDVPAGTTAVGVPARVVWPRPESATADGQAESEEAALQSAPAIETPAPNGHNAQHDTHNGHNGHNGHDHQRVRALADDEEAHSTDERNGSGTHVIVVIPS